MTLPLFVALHGGYAEIALLEYLFHVLLYLLDFGGIVVLVLLGLRVVQAVRSAVVAERGGEKANGERRGARTSTVRDGRGREETKQKS